MPERDANTLNDVDQEAPTKSGLNFMIIFPPILTCKSDDKSQLKIALLWIIFTLKLSISAGGAETPIIDIVF